MSRIRNTPRFLGEALDRYARYAIVALILIPVTPDVVADFVNGDTRSAWVRIAVIGFLVLLVGGLLWTSRKRSARRHATARQHMRKVGWYDMLVLPLSLTPEYRIAGREEAESVPELLIDGADSVNPKTVVLLRSTQIDESTFAAFVANLAEHRPSLRVVPVTLTDVLNPITVFDEVLEALTQPVGEAAPSIADEVAAGATMAVDLTGATALVSLGLARLAHQLNAHCVYVSGTRGPHGRFVLGTQNRHPISVTTLFEPAP